MLYLVNESEQINQHYKLVGELEGFDLTTFDNADDALDHLEKAQDIELVMVAHVIPVRMKNDPKGSRFSYEEANGFMATGHNLIEKLHEARPDLFPGRIVIFDRSLNLQIAQRTVALTRKFGIEAVGSKIKDSYTVFTGTGWTVKNHLASLQADLN